MEKIRQIVFFKEYFHEFYNAQNIKVRNKIDEVLFMMTVIERVPRKFLDHLTGTEGIYEIRVEFAGNIFRIFCCFDEGRLVVLFNGFQKKTHKTPNAEIEKAEKLKNEYFKSKQSHEKQ